MVMEVVVDGLLNAVAAEMARVGNSDDMYIDSNVDGCVALGGYWN